ncbi:MAG: DUF72 domain-containing protein [Desulfobacteraceae bacterium]|nr:DUF72 domain-containing protein [Desulfobacteraceae bacterium]
MSINQIHIGTSGWNYRCFIGRIYPDGAPIKKYLEIYADFFESVELNASFYRSFPKKIWQGWYRRTPDGFLWSVKASRFLTHVKRLDVSCESMKRFWDEIEPLGNKLGVVLFQLPPNLPFERGNLTRFLDMQPDGKRIAIEARHSSWHAEEVWRMLSDHNAAWVISDTAGRYPMSVKVTADFSYVRLHGSSGLYEGLYGEERLSEWLSLISRWGIETFVYFDNTADGSAALDALGMVKLVQSPQ